MLEIFQDTREQCPLCFSSKVLVTLRCLKTGDYTVEGYENDICMERKEEGDLLNCLTWDRPRFERELDRMEPYMFRVLLVESTWGRLHRGEYRSRVHPNAVVGTLTTYIGRHGLLVVMAEDHHFAGIIGESLLKNLAKIVDERRGGSIPASAEEKGSIPSVPQAAFERLCGEQGIKIIDAPTPGAKYGSPGARMEARKR